MIEKANEPLTYTEYAMKKFFTGKSGFVEHESLGLVADIDGEYYIDVFHFLKIKKSVKTKTDKKIIESVGPSRAFTAKFNSSMRQLGISKGKDN